MQLKYILLILISVFIGSCAHVVKLPPPKIPIFKRYPLTVVLYQNQAFKDFKFIFDPTYSFSPSLDLGTPSSLILNATLNTMFDHVLPVDNISNIANKFDGILKPKILGIGGYELVEITYNFILYDKNRQIIKEFKITGRDNTGSWRPESGAGPAMQDAMAQLIIMFQDDPQIKNWLIANKVNILQQNPKP